MYKTLIVAELSCNHNQNFDLALKTIRAMKESGADAVKIQTYTADTLTIKSNKDYFKIKSGTIWDGRTLYDLYNEAYTPWEWQPKLKEYAESLGLIFFSSPFDKSSVDFLEKMKVPMYKIASFEITDIPLIEYVASKNKPVIISTGIASFSDISEAVDACRKYNNNDITLLKCTSAYPAMPEEANLSSLFLLKNDFNVNVGLSDHSMGDIVAVTAVALGATMVEKHFILDRKLGGPDAKFSMNPSEFKKMSKKIRQVEKILGKQSYELSSKAKSSRVFTRSLFAVEDIMEGEMITYKNVKSIRPGYGMAPKFIEAIVGKRAKYFIEKGTPMNIDLVE